MSASARHVRVTAGSSAAIRTVGLPGPAFLDLPFMNCAGRYPVFVSSCTDAQGFSSLDICYRFLEIVCKELFCRHSFAFLKYILINCMMNAHVHIIFNCYLKQCYMYLCFSVNPFQLFMRLLHSWVVVGSF